MFGRKKEKEQKRDSTREGKSAAGDKPSSSPKISVHETSISSKPVRRNFPGPRQADVLLRVALERGAFAELIAHAKESLEAEVCGVLVGQICEDEQGLFVHVEAVIRGAAAAQASTHVTFTQATWNAIHTTLERDFPKLRMVGWYHTHPGFGVEFSDMDLFIQRNFFSGPTQIALVTDPLSGAVAICVNTARGIEYLPRFWVDGREQLCRVPEAKHVAASAPASSGEAAGDLASSLKALEARVGQLVQVMDEQRASYYRFLMFIGFVVCLAVIVSVGYFIYNQFASRNEPPKLNSYVPIPVQIGDKTVLLGVGVAEWQVPPELNAIQLQLEKLKQEAAEKAAKAASKEAKPKAEPSTNAPAASTTTSPPSRTPAK